MQLDEILQLDDLLSTVSSYNLAISLHKHPNFSWTCHLQSITGRLVVGVSENVSVVGAVAGALKAYNINETAPVTTTLPAKSSTKNLQKISLDELM